MKFAVIAAGEGSRLAMEGAGVPKPLVQLQGVPMIERLLRIFVSCRAQELCVIINSQQPATAALLAKLQRELPHLRVVVKDTPSSLHSFYELSPYLRDDKFCLTTVDTVFHAREFVRCIQAFEASHEDGLMGVTSFVDDEKPLYVSTDEDSIIDGFYDTRAPHCHYVSGGIYCLTPRSIDVLERCVEEGVSRMRNFQRRLVSEGLRLKAYPFDTIFDVDHVDDIAKANHFLNPDLQP